MIGGRGEPGFELGGVPREAIEDDARDVGRQAVDEVADDAYRELIRAVVALGHRCPQCHLLGRWAGCPDAHLLPRGAGAIAALRGQVLRQGSLARRGPPEQDQGGHANSFSGVHRAAATHLGVRAVRPSAEGRKSSGASGARPRYATRSELVRWWPTTSGAPGHQGSRPWAPFGYQDEYLMVTLSPCDRTCLVSAAERPRRRPPSSRLSGRIRRHCPLPDGDREAALHRHLTHG